MALLRFNGFAEEWEEYLKKTVFYFIRLCLVCLVNKFTGKLNVYEAIKIGQEGHQETVNKPNYKARQVSGTSFVDLFRFRFVEFKFISILERNFCERAFGQKKINYIYFPDSGGQVLLVYKNRHLETRWLINLPLICRKPLSLIWL